MRPLLALARFESPLSPAWQAAQLASFSAPEHARLARIRLDLRREQFVVGHALLRRLLSDSGCADAAVDVAADGRVLLRAREPVFVSIAHRAQSVAVIVAGMAVGVDIESDHRLRDPRAAAQMLGLAATGVDDTAAVLRAWVAAEARLKAGPDAAAPAWRSTWTDCQLAVAGIANPPLTGVFDAITGTYNPAELHWEAVEWPPGHNSCFAGTS